MVLDAGRRLDAARHVDAVRAEPRRFADCIRRQSARDKRAAQIESREITQVERLAGAAMEIWIVCIEQHVLRTRLPEQTAELARRRARLEPQCTDHRDRNIAHGGLRVVVIELNEIERERAMNLRYKIMGRIHEDPYELRAPLHRARYFERAFETQVSRALRIEVQSDQIGAGIDGRDRILDSCHTADLDSHAHRQSTVVAAASASISRASVS